VQHLWLNAFNHLIYNQPHFALMQYGKSSPLLNQAFQQGNIRQGDYFAAIHQFLQRHIEQGTIPRFPMDIYRALLFSPLIDLINEYFDYQGRPQQIISEEVILSCCQLIIKGLTQ
jgi:TetR/AcrR family transcriptional repressor of multidrug resistance operon